jgi:hypothetical protein
MSIFLAFYVPQDSYEFMPMNYFKDVKFNPPYSNMYIQQDATLHSLFYLETALHVSGGIITHYQEL